MTDLNEALSRAFTNPGEDTVHEALRVFVGFEVARDLIIIAKDIAKDVFSNDVEMSKASLLVSLDLVLSQNADKELKTEAKERIAKYSEDQKFLRRKLIETLKGKK